MIPKHISLFVNTSKVMRKWSSTCKFKFYLQSLASWYFSYRFYIFITELGYEPLFRVIPKTVGQNLQTLLRNCSCKSTSLCVSCLLSLETICFYPFYQFGSFFHFLLSILNGCASLVISVLPVIIEVIRYISISQT